MVGATFVEGMAERLPTGTATVDVALALCSMSHWFDVPKGLSECLRVLKPNGRLVLVEDVFDDPSVGLNGEAIRKSLDTAGYDVTEFREHIHSDGKALVFIAYRKEQR